VENFSAGIDIAFRAFTTAATGCAGFEGVTRVCSMAASLHRLFGPCVWNPHCGSQGGPSAAVNAHVSRVLLWVVRVRDAVWAAPISSLEGVCCQKIVAAEAAVSVMKKSS
jgi:hypothetical protein